ncbi:hypothetical protein C9374_009869 [Naegleria lovaniensis]|uniref:Double-strand break repair protein n=1 Tax=Naegleria lovaniensis TaxID=51637 RepID=A0AA88KGW0_NAELO|nr:uncharacterized protein C9374_009869 [Naegleria lovaniensis]KAG2375246.1 hypothetical protein C9374_009869 [Naegleria lovaniensis]
MPSQLPSQSQRGIREFRTSSQRNFMETDEDGVQPVPRASSSSPEEPMDEKDILRILITTDNHVGFNERDPVRKEDSFIIFEEIMQYAHRYNVDFVLQGGDLFHDNKPSRDTLHKTIAILRKYVFGDKPVPLQILSDQSVNFKSNPGGTVNYEDPNVNIALPIFSISGNHDAWSGENSLSVLDVLSQCNLINYFGKCETVDQIQVKPILMQKGETKLALYGLGYIRDERLYQTFKNQKVTFFRPAGEDSQNASEWFNLFAIHQNRNQHHNKKGNISESMLKGFFDLVVWGHEHEQQIVPTRSVSGGFEVMQPGSSITTTYTPQEAKPKKVAVLEIYKDTFRVIPITLKTVRPFVFDTISLADYEDDLKHIKNNPEEIADFLKEHVNQLISQAREEKLSSFENDEEAKKELKNYYKKYPGLDLPIVRLRVDYSGGYASINPQRFGQNFVGKVANPSDLLLLSRKKSEKVDTAVVDDDDDKEKVSDKRKRSKEQLLTALIKNDNNEEFADAATDALTDGIKIEDLVSHYLKETSTKKSGIAGLLVLNEFEFQNSVVDFVEKEELHAIDDFVSADIKTKQKRLWSDLKQALKQSDKDSLTEEELEAYLQKYREEARANFELNRYKIMGDRLLKKASSSTDGDHDEEEEEQEEEEEKPKKKKSTRKKKADSEEEEEKPKKRTSSRSKKKVDEDDEEEDKPKKKAPKRKKKDSDEEEEEVPKKKTTRGSKSTKAKPKFKAIDDDDEVVEEEPPKKKTTRGRPKKKVEEEEEKPKRRTAAKKKVVDDEDAIVIDDDDE